MKISSCSPFSTIFPSNFDLHKPHSTTQPTNPAHGKKKLSAHNRRETPAQPAIYNARPAQSSLQPARTGSAARVITTPDVRARGRPRADSRRSRAARASFYMYIAGARGRAYGAVASWLACKAIRAKEISCTRALALESPRGEIYRRGGPITYTAGRDACRGGAAFSRPG